MAEYRQAFARAVRQPEFFVPIEFRSSDGPEADLARTQSFVQNFGRLLTWWPTIWREAHAVSLVGW